MKKFTVTLGLVLVGLAGADREHWRVVEDRHDAREERREAEFQRREAEHERMWIEQERMRIEMERERLRREDEMRNRHAWRHGWGRRHVFVERCEHPVVIERRQPTVVVAESEPVRRPSARIELEFPLGR